MSCLWCVCLCPDCPDPNKTFMKIHHLLKQPPQSTKHFLLCLLTVHFLLSWSLQVRPAVAERRTLDMLDMDILEYIVYIAISQLIMHAPLLGSSMGRWSAMSSTITKSSLLSFITLATSSALKSGLAALVQRTIWIEFIKFSFLTERAGNCFQWKIQFYPNFVVGGWQWFPPDAFSAACKLIYF